MYISGMRVRLRCLFLVFLFCTAGHSAVEGLRPSTIDITLFGGYTGSKGFRFYPYTEAPITLQGLNSDITGVGKEPFYGLTFSGGYGVIYTAENNLVFSCGIKTYSYSSPSIALYELPADTIVGYFDGHARSFDIGVAKKWEYSVYVDMAVGIEAGLGSGKTIFEDAAFYDSTTAWDSGYLTQDHHFADEFRWISIGASGSADLVAWRFVFNCHTGWGWRWPITGTRTYNFNISDDRRIPLELEGGMYLSANLGIGLRIIR